MFSTAIGDSGMKVGARSYTGAVERKGPMERVSPGRWDRQRGAARRLDLVTSAGESARAMIRTIMAYQPA
jgi:hypothetical protein